MMKRLLTFLPILCAAAMFYFSMPSHGVFQQAGAAVGEIQTSDAQGTVKSCATIPEAQGGVLLGRIVPCLIHTIEESTISFAGAMIDIFEPLIYAFLTFAVVMFGIRVLQGEQQIGVQGFLFIFKIALIVGMLQWIPHHGVGAGSTKGGIQSVYGVINDGVTIVTGALGPDSAAANSINCDVGKYGNELTPQLWKQMDCVVGKLYGFSTGTGTNPDGSKPVNMVLAASAVGLLSGFFFGGTLGVIVFFALIGVLVSVFLLVLRVALAFLNGYLMVCVMMILTPLFLPLVLLRITNDYFEKWWKIMLGGILLPIIITAYAVMALTIYDKLLFAPDSKLQILFKQDIVERAWEHQTKPCDMTVTGNPNTKAADQQALNEKLKSPFLQNFAQPLLSTAADACSLFKMDKFEITKVTGMTPEGGKKAMEDLFQESIQLFVMAFVISAGLKSVQGSLGSFVGSSSVVATMSRADDKVTGAINQMQANMARAFQSEDGGTVKDMAFVRQAPEALQRAGQGFLDGMIKR